MRGSPDGTGVMGEQLARNDVIEYAGALVFFVLSSFDVSLGLPAPSCCSAQEVPRPNIPHKSPR
jgi:hypothetical protein